MFYDYVSEIYDEVFPVNNLEVNFFINLLNETKNPSFLDIGCGTGNLVIEIAKKGFYSVGIDLNSKMIESARNKSFFLKNLKFQTLNMLDISKKFSDKKFDVISCLGNTIVHLNNIEEINFFVNSVKKILNTNGYFVIQMINYDYILKNKIKRLPDIKYNQTVFERYYEYETDTNKIKFKIKIIQNNKEVIDETFLYPLKYNEILEILKENNFKNITFFNSYNEEYFENKLFNVIVAY